MDKYEIYACDTETTGIELENDIIEVSLIRLSTGEQKTWFLRPLNVENISTDALRINGHKLEDLKGLTAFGKETYLDPQSVVLEIEKWVCDDFVSSDDRFLMGQNLPGFDKPMLEALWKKCNANETYPFSRRRSIDTMGIELVFDLAKNNIAEGYSLRNLCKKHGIINSKAHSASSDCLATKEIFLKQIDYIRKLCK
jgi:DNA polymerase III epsilon subunit-like protein